MRAKLNARFSFVNMLLIVFIPVTVHTVYMWKKIDQRMAELGLKDADLARALGVESQHVHNWRKRGIPAARFKQVADALDRPIDWLFQEEDAATHVAEPPGVYQNQIDTDAADLVEFFRSLDRRGRADLLAIAAILSSNARKTGK